MKIRIRKADVTFSLLVRCRANWTCENCGVDKMGDPGTFDCAHIMSRRSVGLRWHPQNALGLCRGCHIFFTAHPFDWSDFCKEKYGEERVAELRLVSNQVVKWSPKVREEIFKHMKQQVKVGTFEPHELFHVFKESK